jgi:hypothetical protein
MRGAGQRSSGWSGLPRFLSEVYELPATEDQLERIEETLQVRETLFAVVPGAVG